MNAPGTPTSRTITVLLRILVLTYGGTALLQWVQLALFGGLPGGAAAGYSAWLRDSILALPLVAGAVFLSRRTSAPTWRADLGRAALFAALMGGGFLMRQATASPDHAHAEAAFSSGTVLLQSGLLMLVAGLFALGVGGAGRTLDGPLAALSGRFALPRPWTYAAGVLIALLLIAPVLVTPDAGYAIAQTSFPDQVIHPKGSLTLIARKLSDGSLAYVAPDYGANGLRPTIEMSEGETLNITLKNELTTDVSLHVHGVHYNLDSDGTRHSNSFVRPGQQRVYQWRAPAGTAGYWHYHDHVVGDDEGSGGILSGLYGGLVVRKPGDPKPARTFVLVGNDKTINGAIFPDTPTLTARQGELVEFLIISHGNRVHTFHLHGHHWITPTRGGDPNPALPANVGSGAEDNHILAPGDSFGFLVIAGDDVGPGMWMYHCHFQDHASSMKGYFNVLPAAGQGNQQKPTSRTFAETGKTVAGRFLEYWEQNGGLAQQGFPLSEPFMEKSELDGKEYLVQYFERSVFELHPENSRPYDVLLAQLGTYRYKEKYPAGR
jgi:hypothetical protein